ncbi:MULTISPECIES: efflux transporter outer membrane subunit [unclassified Sphingobium]|uniref:efflux transporter outer membrane subunit n=1 Tax=unclassified Sphingobium TaxID=2611147 RepID=UPI0008308059|nr:MULTISPECIES: efflux transporter outer membrane subunit [unclassified Sphingobium]NML89751.1 efflux transporter outer membrane subunit [Sphingobium sp. TB-6]
MRKRGWTPLLALALAACATAGPDYRPPEQSAATAPGAQGAFLSAQGAGFSNAELPDHWWRLYDDPRLDALVEQALSANTDLRVADANLIAAEAVLREAEAGRTIGTAISGGVSLARPSGTGESLPGVVGYDLGLGASYPLDLNGRIKRAIEASTADLETVVAARDYVRVSVAAATAKAYAQVCAANYSLAVNRRVVALQRETLNATQRLFKGGRGTAFDVSRARAAVDASEASLPAFEAQRQSGLYLLATLLGRAPADYPKEVEGCASLPVLHAPLPVGDGAALIRRRPDIRQVEREIAADTARVGVATADLYPQISIGGSLGLGGPLKSFGSGTSFGMSLGPLLSWSFPNRPVVKARIAQADAQVQADLARFDGTVLEALRQTETALESYRRHAEQAAALDRARDSAGVSAGQAGKLFRFGRGDFLSLLDAQRSLAGAEASAAAARVQLVQDQIAIFLALGGGWSRKDDGAR